MSTPSIETADAEIPVEHVDVLVVGAGISGIGAARYVAVEHPEKSIVILEGRDRLGGTWDLFKYPGIRSDSDLHTFGYDFKPWTEREAIADAHQILAYLQETVDENGLRDRIRCGQRVVAADWDSAKRHWVVTVERSDSGERFQMTAWWIFAGTGYYNYDEGYTPVFEGRDRFQGQIVHPQHWPEDLDYAGKKVVVIGSGATAVTLIPSMADKTAKITMLQRTPSYIMPLPKVDPVAIGLQKAFGDERGYALARRFNIGKGRMIYSFCQNHPKAARKLIRFVNARALPRGYDVDTHFNPPYNPWDQRLCAVPNADLFTAIRKGKADVVTDRIVTFDETGIQLESGDHLDADIIVTATGLNLQLFGGMALSVDGKPVTLSDCVVHRGTMLSGVPNLSIIVGYTNSSWTLKVGILCPYVCQLFDYMDEHGYDVACVQAAPGMETRPLLDFGAGYVQRSVSWLPKQGDHAPWRMSMGFAEDKALLDGPLISEGLTFSGPE
ncbi:flavin-containing monooxygenase [Mycolicibacterium brumae]|uniref:NAD(P)/FAD-dependent oxidoreductase n=1 Tax=Mycolicibacterium brumae TaxID=85968 RepID=A0A2G5P984_9MYCO|nr:NAD(P)/FAD-dependent oxidoreductase [Mycolicibacterium brumae]MCV7193960.1 NAD(P)/FAD-dependent oxidoreductase [Mycolicibacterium brumae]PIB74912.1 NAD(P)/FAD-dependent oxidoreductase [Mycolicibacterium brumae]RWA22463.1 hypothetical protein MBRU_12840 [Mycolicibacterium brumae DSM 44177]UWW08009.1 NAD(P)/FAD-dependent oxidoreductase [Mycolicibacterium brumae]